MADEIFDEQHGAALRELWTLIGDVRIAMLTTVGTDGRLHSRPMATQQVEPEDVLLRLTQMLTAAVSGRPPQTGPEDRKLQL